VSCVKCAVSCECEDKRWGKGIFVPPPPPNTNAHSLACSLALLLCCLLLLTLLLIRHQEALSFGSRIVVLLIVRTFLSSINSFVFSDASSVAPPNLFRPCNFPGLPSAKTIDLRVQIEQRRGEHIWLCITPLYSRCQRWAPPPK
jgi:hypothetical protein